jgi:hypothetical protein
MRFTHGPKTTASGQRTKRQNDNENSLALELALLTTTPALAVGEDQMGVGLSPCAEFAKLSKRSPANEMIFYSWAQGFISAANFSRLMQGGDSVNVSATSQEEQRRQLRDFCNTHPLKEFRDAVADLINHMPVNVGSAADAAAKAEALEK